MGFDLAMTAKGSIRVYMRRLEAPTFGYLSLIFLNYPLLSDPNSKTIHIHTTLRRY
jgi:hypothetical protein